MRPGLRRLRPLSIGHRDAVRTVPTAAATIGHRYAVRTVPTATAIERSPLRGADCADCAAIDRSPRRGAALRRVEFGEDICSEFVLFQIARTSEN